MNENYFRGKKILISGASSFIGRNLIPKLKDEGAEIITIGRKSFPEFKHIYVDFLTQDIPTLVDLEFNYFVHLAAFSSPARAKDEEQVMKLNFESTYKLFNQISNKNIDKCIFMSTSAVYESNQSLISENSPLRNNPDFYSKSKILAEEKLLDLISKGVPLIIYRLSNAYGPHQGWKKESGDCASIVSCKQKMRL